MNTLVIYGDKMKKIPALLLCLLVFGKVFSCEVKYIISFAGCSKEHKIKDKCATVRQETDKMLLQLDHNKDIICLGKTEENGSVIMTYDDAGVIKKVIFKKCKKDKMRNKLYCMFLIGLYNERGVF